MLAVSKIPYGEVRSYKWIARRIGRPNAFRAIGQALKKNPLPFIIPCHRVVRSDYKLGGFIFGKKLKRELLSKEGLTIEKNTIIINTKERTKNVRGNKRKIR